VDIMALALDKYVSYRLEGLGCEVALVAAKLEAHRYLLDFTYYSGEAIPDELYGKMIFILEDPSFSQKAELAHQNIKNRKKSPLVS
jgi:hypothetical protein